MNNFLYCELVNNSFIVNLDFYIDNLNQRIKSLSCKLDTGCSISVLNYFSIDPNLTRAQLKKIDDIDNKVKYVRSYGVESSGFARIVDDSDSGLMQDASLKFKHTLTNLVIDDYSIPPLNIGINYDRRGIGLLGMDILNKFDFHIGFSNKVNNVVFTGVLQSQVDKSNYYQALYEHFGLVEEHSQIAKGLRNIFRRNK